MHGALGTRLIGGRSPGEQVFYLALKSISKKWTLPIRDWKAAVNHFTIQFEDRLLPAQPTYHLHRFPDTALTRGSVDGLNLWMHHAI